MTTRLCPICKTKWPANQFEAHRQQHKNAGKEPHWGGREGQQARTAALRRDRYRCQSCDRTKTQLDRLGVQLHVHHVDEDRTNNRLSNLKTLCEDCHPRGAKPAQK